MNLLIAAYTHIIIDNMIITTKYMRINKIIVNISIYSMHVIKIIMRNIKNKMQIILMYVQCKISTVHIIIEYMSIIDK